MVAVSSRYRSSSSASIEIHLLFIRINYPKQSTDSFALVLEQGSLFDSPSWLFIHGHAFSGSKAVMHSSPSWWSHPPQESSSPRSSQGDHGGLQHRSVLLLASSWAWLWWAQPWWQHSWASAMGPLVTLLSGTALWRCLKLAPKICVQHSVLAINPQSQAPQPFISLCSHCTTLSRLCTVILPAHLLCYAFPL